MNSTETPDKRKRHWLSLTLEVDGKTFRVYEKERGTLEYSSTEIGRNVKLTFHIDCELEEPFDKIVKTLKELID